MTRVALPRAVAAVVGVDLVPVAPADQVREGDSIVVHGKHLTSAAFAALLFAGNLGAQQLAPVTSVTLTDAIRRAQLVSPTVVGAIGGVRSAELSIRTQR
jgi:hypothetical protein